MTALARRTDRPGNQCDSNKNRESRQVRIEMSSTTNDEPNHKRDGLESSRLASTQERDTFSVARLAKLTPFGLLIAGLIYFYFLGDLTQENLKSLGAALPTHVFLPAFLVLPLFGFPISIALLASGMKYGFGECLLIAVFGMAFHTWAAWHLANGIFRERLENWLKATRFEMPSIPANHQIWFTSLFVTVPGLPYAIKLYSLAMTNLSFRRYFLIVWFFHVLNAVPFIGIGIAAAHVSLLWLIGFGILALAVLLLSYWLKKRFAASP